MAHVAPIYPNFARGEVSPLMFGRIDIEQYPSCLDKCRNVYIRPYGCASRLTGTEFISQTKNSGKVRLLKFVFSATDSYIIECGAGYFRFYQNGAPVMKNGAVYEITNNYYEDQLDSIQYVQLDDIIKLTCLPHNNDNTTARPKELIRNASDSWTFRNVTFNETPYLDQNTSSITMTPSATTGNDITITASSAYFTKSMEGANLWIGTKVKDTETNKDVQGYVQILENNANSSTIVHAKVMSKLSGTTATKLWGEGAFSDRRGYPSCVALYDGRLWYGRTPTQPRNIYGSKPYAYETFTPAVDNEDDAGINIQLATNANGDGSDIKWMIGGSYLLCGTYGGEFVIRGTGDAAITATDISAKQRTNWGGEPIQPIVAGTFVHFIQRNGNKLRQFQYDYYYDAYKAVDVSIFSEHLLESPIKEMALQKNPDSIIYLMREDGKVVMLTLEQDQSVQAWSLLEDFGAKVESIQTIPSYDGNFDEVYMVMQRNQLATALDISCTNQSLVITDNYTGTKSVAGTEIVTLTYDGDYDVWTTPDSNSNYTKLTVVSSNENLTPSTSYNDVKSEVGTVTEVLEFVSSQAVFWDDPSQIANLGTNGWIDVINNGIKFIAISGSGYVSGSSNGATWSSAAADPSAINKNWKSITSGNGNIIALGSAGHIGIGTFVNSMNWYQISQVSELGNRNWRGIAAGNSQNVLAISKEGYISTSTDYGLHWNTAAQNTTLKNRSIRWVDLAYGNGVYMALSEDGYIAISTTGSSWETFRFTFTTSTDEWKSVIYDGTNFVVLSRKGKIIGINKNGVSIFEGGNISSQTNWAALGYKNSKFVALTGSGYVSTGLNGIWQSQTTGLNVDLSNELYKITVEGDAIIGDTLTCTWNTITNYTPLSRYNLTVTGTPVDEDTITLEYTTTYSGDPIRYIERMLDPITPDNPKDWWYVRSGLKYDGFARTKGITLTLSANGGTVTATASSSIFTSSMVGNRIRFIDDNYNILGEGEITEYTSGTVVTLKITTYFQSLSMAGGTWGISTDSLSGLDHLNKRTVQVFADGKQQADKVVADGSIDIEDAFIAVVGLPYTSYITTMPMEAGSQNGTAVGKRKRISEMAIRVWNSLGVRVGRDLDNLYDTIYEQQEPFTGVIPNIKYNQGWVWDANITVEQSHPYPMNILSIAPIVTEVDK